MLSEVLNSSSGSLIVSVILGLGLASFFKKVCKEGKCVVIQGPDVNDVQKNVYKMDDSCYKYTPKLTACKRQ